MKLGKLIMNGNLCATEHHFWKFYKSWFHKWCSGARHVTNSRKWCRFGKLSNMDMCCFTNTRAPLMNMIIRSWIRKWCAGASQLINSRKERSLGKLQNMKVCCLTNTREPLLKMVMKSWFHKWCSGANQTTNSRKQWRLAKFIKYGNVLFYGHQVLENMGGKAHGLVSS